MSVHSVLPDLTLADRHFLLTLPDTANVAELVAEIKSAILKDGMFECLLLSVVMWVDFCVW